MPLKMWVAEGAANRVTRQLIPTEVHSGCTASPSDVNTVGLLMSADEVCVYRQPIQWCGSATPPAHTKGSESTRALFTRRLAWATITTRSSV